jgi:ATP-binding cassette subfamily F protein 3
MVLACQNISKSFGDTDILKKVNFHIEEREKAALVGVNGAGKSTLLKIIMGQLAPDEGQVLLGKGATIGYLSQQPDYDVNMTIYEAMVDAKRYVFDLEQRIRKAEQDMKQLSGEPLAQLMDNYTRMTHEFEYLDGYSATSEIVGVLKGLQFSEADFDKDINLLSGGQRTRVALARLLLLRPDIILLDEPTNHLDIASISWLEQFLTTYKGAVFIVSHDRYFLNRVVTKVVDLERANVTVFQGNYTQYAEKKAALRKEQMNAYLNQQREIKHQEEVIAKLRQFNREKSIKRAESRVKMLNKMDVLEQPTQLNATMRITLEPSIISGNDVLTITDLSKAFDTHCLFSHLDISIKRGEKVALIGANGTGKTTLLKIINKQMRADSGRVQLGSKVKIGYYDQAQQLFREENTIFDEVSDSYQDLNNTRIRNVLAAFLFTGDDVFKTVSSLSGGERGRLSLAKLMLSNANFLILDEPTNHLDVYSKEILEDALKEYTGTVFYVSHDRYFVNQTATRILELEGETVTQYKGNYDYYLEKKAEAMANAASPNPAEQTKDTTAAEASKLNWQEQKAEQARQRKRANELKKVEQRISELEAEAAELDARMAEPSVACDNAELVKLSTQRGAVEEELSKLYDTWETLAQ